MFSLLLEPKECIFSVLYEQNFWRQDVAHSFVVFFFLEQIELTTCTVSKKRVITNNMSLFVNQRIQLVHGPHNRGTVRYIGPVPGQPSHQQWVGVEWDDETKGKHNGTVNQTMQLFTTFQNRNSASFVKLDKLLQAISTQGANDECSVMNHVSLTDAIQQRYVNAPNEKLIELTLGKSMRVEIVGADKIASKMAQVSTLEKMGLPSCKISSVDGIGELCPSMCCY